MSRVRPRWESFGVLAGNSFPINESVGIKRGLFLIFMGRNQAYRKINAF
jgi:hypothetical protein